MKSIQFLCQREQDTLPDESCHVACLHMLLKFVDFSPMPTYADLCRSLNLLDGPDLPYDSSLEEITKFIVRHNLHFRITFRRQDWEESLRMAPIMVAMYGCRRFWGDEGHTILLTQLNHDIFTYLDPWFSSSSGRNIKTISITSFYKYYLGFACQLLP